MNDYKKRDIIQLEMKYTKFIKEIIKEMNTMRHKIEIMEKPTLQKQIIYKTIENKNAVQEYKHTINELKNTIIKKDKEIEILKLEMAKNNEKYTLDKQGLMTEIQLLNSSLNSLNAAILE